MADKNWLSEYTQFPIHKAKVEGQDFAWIEKGEGPLVLCLHGFPDNAIAWEATLDALAGAGFRAVAPFLPGYFPSGLSKDGTYPLPRIAKQFFALATHLGATEFSIAGHDWGASVAYFMANLHPERIKKLVALAIPHPRAIKPSLKLLLKAKHFLHFRFKKRAMKKVPKNNFRYLDKQVFARWSPNWDQPESHREMIKKGFSEPGYLRAALAWYWSYFDGQDDPERKKYAYKKTEVPTLIFAGEADGTILLEFFQNPEKYFTKEVEVVYLPKAGHFPVSEATETVNAKMLEFLQA